MKGTFAIIITLIFSLTAVNRVFSIPAEPSIREMKMPDGSIVRARLIGDEYLGRFETEDGYTVILNTNGYFEYAIKDEYNELALSGIKVSETPPPIKKHLNHSQEKYLQRKSPMRVRAKEIQMATIRGTVKAIVLLVEYPDYTHTSPTNFNTLYFGSSQGTLNHYLSTVSYGALTLTGAVNSWFTAADDKEDYGCLDRGAPDHTGAKNLVIEAILAADATVDFSQYDQDGNGTVDHLVVIHAGPDAADAGSGGTIKDIWSHRGYISTDAYPSGVPVDGKRVNSYVINSEDTYIGVHAHEFLHGLGARDLYDPYAFGEPISRWCIMDYGAYNGSPAGSNPSWPCGYVEYDIDSNPANGVNGWLDLTTLTLSNTYTLAELSASSGNRLYKVAISGTDEYFLLENRQLTGYDSSLTESGMLIYHVDEAMPSNQPTLYLNNAFSTNFRIAVDGPGGPSTSAFSLDDGQTSFTDVTNPNSKANDGTASNISITNISASQSNMTFTLSVLLTDSDSDGYDSGTDCNDGDATINPGATETADDGIDQNCNGYDLVTYYEDDDSDGYGNPSTSQQSETGTAPTGYVVNNTDCNDLNANINPATVWYLDADFDGYSEGTTSGPACSPRPTNYFYAAELTAPSGDCNDSNANINPGVNEIPGDAIDQNCDGLDTINSGSSGSGGGGCFIATASYDDNELSAVDRLISWLTEFFD